MLFDTEVCHSRLWSPGDTEYSPRKAESCSLGKSGIICIAATGLSFFNILLVCLKAPKKRRLDPEYGKRYYDSFEGDDDEHFVEEDSALDSYYEEEDVEEGDHHVGTIAAASGGTELPPPPPSTKDQTPIARNARLPVHQRDAISGGNTNSSNGEIQNASSEDDSIKIEISLDGSGAIAHLTPKTSRSRNPPQQSGGSNVADRSSTAVGATSAHAQAESGENNLIDQCINQLAKSFAAASGDGILRTEEEERKENEEGI